MSGRRGILGGLAALGIGGAAPRGAVGMGPVPAQLVGGQVGSAGVALASEIVGHARAQRSLDPGLLSLFRQRVDAEWARRARMQRRMDLCGGVPPGVAACRSWRPWFAAAVSERWVAENLSDPRDFERAIWKAVFGHEMEGQ